MVYLEEISIKNFRNITDRTFKFSDVSVVRGAHRQGKSSTVDSLAALFEPGGDPEDISHGAKNAIVSLRMANGYSATKKVTPKSVVLEVLDQNGGAISAPATKLNELLPKDAFNTRDLMHLIYNDPKGLEKWIFGHLPLSVPAAAVNDVLGEQIAKTPLSISEIKALKKRKYDERRDVNAEADSARKTLASLEQAIGDDDGRDWGSERDRLDGDIAAVNESLSTLRREAVEAVSGQLSSKQQEVSSRISSLREQISAAERELVEFDSQLRSKARDILDSDSAALIGQRDALQARRSVAAAKADQQQRATGVRDEAESQRRRLHGKLTQSTKLTNVIDSLEDLATRAISDIGIEGLEITDAPDGEHRLTLNGDSVSKINGAGRVVLAIKLLVAAQRASGSEFKVLVAEGGELLPSAVAELAEACIDAGVQLLVTMKEEDAELEVEDVTTWLARQRKTSAASEQLEPAAVA